MSLNWLDWVIIFAYFALSLGIGLYFRRRAQSSVNEFFVAGRAFPWWIAGVSMVATTFAADTPLAVTGLTIQRGIAGNWLWWSYALGGMITVFVFARLWRRAEVLTDVELIELRYGGGPAALLRGFRAIYLALPINCIVIAWVNFAMLSVLKHTLLEGDWLTPTFGKAAAEFLFKTIGPSAGDWVIVIGCLALTGLYTVLSGMWGVAITDVIQFVIAMIGCIVLAILAVKHIGGTDALRERVVATFPGGESAFQFFPDFSAKDAWLTPGQFAVYLFVIWWASWYPGAEPGGGGYVVQRMSSCKTEKDSLLATLLFQVAHYCVRPWPWLLVALAALVAHPNLRTEWLANDKFDPGVGFPMMMRDLLPEGLRGLLLVAFFAAYMSTISTQINWGAGYLVNDVFRRFINPQATERQLGRAARIASILIVTLGALVTPFVTSVSGAWSVMLALGAGMGSVLMLRWFWWRINAWSEISAMVLSLVCFAALKLSPIPKDSLLAVSEYQTLVIAIVTVIGWLGVTFITAPESPEVLNKFFRKVRPAGPGWSQVAASNPDIQQDRGLGKSLLCAALASGIVFFTLPGMGFLIFGSYAKGFGCLAAAAAFAGAVYWLLSSTDWTEKSTK